MNRIIGLVLIFIGAFIAAGAKGITFKIKREFDAKLEIVFKIIGCVFVLAGALLIFGIL